MSNEFDMKDSGMRRTFETGAQRDRGDLKPRPDLISPYALERVGWLLAKGAAKYSARNWERGMPVSIFTESLFRHLMSFMQGDRSEDHLAAIIFNAQGIIHFEELAKRGDRTAWAMLDEFASKVLADELNDAE